MKRTLKRELKVPEIAEMEANGTSHFGKIAACYCEGGLSATRVLQFSLTMTWVVFLASPVNVSSRLRKTSRTW